MRNVSVIAILVLLSLSLTTHTEAATCHVSLTGGNVSPYASWSDAATDIQSAVNVATNTGDLVLVSNGTYTITTQLLVTNDITLRAVNGAQTTTIDAGSVAGRRVLRIDAADAVIDGFTLTRGYNPSENTGGGIYMTAGTVMNCTVTNNRAKYGGGIYISGGSVSNCVVTKCTANDQGGGGLHIAGGSVVDSDILNNICSRAGNAVLMSAGELRGCRVSGNSGGWSGAVNMTGGTAENCLITRNAGGSYQGGGGVFMNNAAARLVNCTVADNNTQGVGGGVRRNSGIISNCVVYFNVSSFSGSPDNIYGTANCLYSCSPDLVDDPGGTGNISGEPQFSDRSGDDYRLAPGSPCIDAGGSLADVTDDRDGAARPKDGDGTGGAAHDMGCYEAEAADAGPFRCNFSAPTNQAPLSLNAVFTSYVYGTTTNGLYYWWDFGDAPAQEAATRRS